MCSPFLHDRPVNAWAWYENDWDAVAFPLSADAFSRVRETVLADLGKHLHLQIIGPVSKLQILLSDSTQSL